jgi:GT2 family glycosyltransferase
MPRLGVVVVTFASADVILDCLESLLAARGIGMDIVVVDNDSPDDTLQLLRRWAAGETVPLATDLPFEIAPTPKPVPLDGSPIGDGGHSVTLLETGVNAGFAAGVNRGLALLAARPGIDRFWVLNPDSVVPPDTPRAFAEAPGGFSLLGGRLIYLEKPDLIQIDGGVIRWATGTTRNTNQFRPAQATPPPDPARLDFISGASMVASRAFLDRAGPMPEEYFLYYEEVDWALRRGDLPLAYCERAVVYHRAGTAIGSPAPGRPASVFSLYFKHRGRLRFLRRWRRSSLATGYLFSLAKAAQLALKGYFPEALTVLRASLDLAPPASVRTRLSTEAAERAFAPPLRPDGGA